MDALSKYWIQIINLKNKNYRYDYLIDDSFFDHFENSPIEKGSLKCLLSLDKTDNYIQIHFNIEGRVELTCDRTLDKFDHPLTTDHQIMFKFGEEDREIDDEVEMISRSRQGINVAQYIYEFVSTSIPMKKLHPRFKDEDEEDDQLIYRSNTDETGDQEGEKEQKDIDPRWETLLKLRNQLN